MKVEIRTHQIAKSSWAHDGLKVYSKKISNYCDFEFKTLKSEKSLLQNINDQDIIILCDERGEELSSRGFAKKMELYKDSGKKVVVIVGGPFGVEEKLRKKAKLIISLSSFVMNQEVALITIFEQIFRAFTIMNNLPYHND